MNFDEPIPPSHISDEHVGLVHAVEMAASVGILKNSRLRAVADISSGFIVIIALLLTGYTLHSSDSQIKTAGARNVCSGRYQDIVDEASNDTLTTIGELVVVITQVPPGPARETAVTAKVAQLGVANEQSRLAVKAKAEYNKAGRPLPCPLAPTQP